MKEFYLAEYTFNFIFIREIKMEQDLHFEIVLIMSLKALVVLIFSHSTEVKGLMHAQKIYTLLKKDFQANSRDLLQQNQIYQMAMREERLMMRLYT